MSCLSHLIKFNSIKNVHYTKDKLDYILELNQDYNNDDYYSVYQIKGSYVDFLFNITKEQLSIIQEMVKDPIINIRAEDLEKTR